MLSASNVSKRIALWSTPQEQQLLSLAKILVIIRGSNFEAHEPSSQRRGEVRLRGRADEAGEQAFDVEKEGCE